MIIAVDFDGTLVEHRFPEIGPRVPGAFEWLQVFKSGGATLILWTVRSDGEPAGDVLSAAVEYSGQCGVVFDYVNVLPHPWSTSQKICADVFIDDRGVGCPMVHPPDGRLGYVDWERVGPVIYDMMQLRKVGGAF